MSGRRVFFYVQHLLGIGHQRRAATLTRAMQAAGLEVTFVSGGHRIPGLDLAGARLVQLPATRAVDLYFKKLVDEHDRPIDDAWRADRRARLLAAYEACRPHVVILELFPFGRRQMRFELMPLLERAAAEVPRPAIVSSVRDILVEPPKPERLSEMLDLVERRFDHVLVHGDPALIPFDATFPHAREIADRLHYTGYVVDRTGSADETGDGAGEVVVSAGGGAVGERLLATAIAARPLTRLAGRTWRVLVGVKVEDAVFERLRAEAPEGVIVERARGDFPSLLMRCALSISQAGYNTVMESLHAGCRAVVVPYAGGLETEQTLRAGLLAKRGLLTVLPEDALSPERLAAAVEQALDRPGGRAGGLQTDGAEVTARLVAGWAAGVDRP
ncbi:MAG TPA: glycosyltransferase [Alphaproteobacteria bacterium]|nr:glycosyltransferase [Alphaproteobacteria bacterium]